ncbi:MAG: hypothetical protein K6B69_10795 [Lachnospiraceae bacterium]|nr:hypothetical protein [Lachnospiraceae bacterium]
MGKRTKIHIINRTADTDIRYRGPLSYRHLLIMGWLGIVFMIVGVWTNLGITMDPNSPAWIVTLNHICTYVGNMALPMLLLADFCIILDQKKTYSQLLKKYAQLTLAIVALYMIIYGRYLTGVVDLFARNKRETRMIVTAIIREGTRTGDLAFNIFIDMFLCTLFMLFLNYVPKKGFFSKHLLAFRYLSVLPVLYEISSLVIRMLSAAEKIKPSFYIYPFLTTKAPMSFVMFVLLALYIKFREHIFLINGKTHSDYKAFLRTNANSWQFSVYASFILVITCVIDLVLFIVFITGVSNETIKYMSTESAEEKVLESEIAEDFGLPDMSGEDMYNASILYGVFDSGYDTSESEVDESELTVTANDISKSIIEGKKATGNSILDQVKAAIIMDSGSVAYAWGFGKHVSLIVLLPFLLLLSYTKVYNNMKFDSMIPFGGVIFSILVSLECLYQGILMFAPSLIDNLAK